MLVIPPRNPNPISRIPSEPPPLFDSFLEQGGVFAGVNMLRKKSGRRPEIFVVLVFKIAWGTLRKRSKSMIFAREIMFPKCIISKISRLRRATLPATFNLYSGRAPPTQACFQIYRRLSRSLHVRKTFFTNWLARYDLVIIIFTGGYRALYTCTKRVYKL